MNTIKYLLLPMLLLCNVQSAEGEGGLEYGPIRSMNEFFLLADAGNGGVKVECSLEKKHFVNELAALVIKGDTIGWQVDHVLANHKVMNVMDGVFHTNCFPVSTDGYNNTHYSCLAVLKDWCKKNGINMSDFLNGKIRCTLDAAFEFARRIADISYSYCNGRTKETAVKVMQCMMFCYTLIDDLCKVGYKTKNDRVKSFLQVFNSSGAYGKKRGETLNQAYARNSFEIVKQCCMDIHTTSQKIDSLEEKDNFGEREYAYSPTGYDMTDIQQLKAVHKRREESLRLMEEEYKEVCRIDKIVRANVLGREVIQQAIYALGKNKACLKYGVDVLHKTSRKLVRRQGRIAAMVNERSGGNVNEADIERLKLIDGDIERLNSADSKMTARLNDDKIAAHLKRVYDEAMSIWSYDSSFKLMDEGTYKNIVATDVKMYYESLFNAVLNGDEWEIHIEKGKQNRYVIEMSIECMFYTSIIKGWCATRMGKLDDEKKIDIFLNKEMVGIRFVVGCDSVDRTKRFLCTSYIAGTDWKDLDYSVRTQNQDD